MGIIFLFNFYISVAKNYQFSRRFFDMAGISLGVAALSFGIDIQQELPRSYLHFPPSVISSRHEPTHDYAYQRQGPGLRRTG